MKKIQLFLGGLLLSLIPVFFSAVTFAAEPPEGYEVESLSTECGLMDITLIKHGSLAVMYKDMTIQIDPVAGFGKPTDYAKDFGKADFILVTHEHPDHLDEATLKTLMDGHTKLYLNKTSRDKIGFGTAVANGDSFELYEGVRVEVVPAYNTTPGREKFHPKGNGNGYILDLDGFRIYIAGDTEDIPEMAELGTIDMAFLPVNQPYTMTPDQCVHAAEMIKPTILIPYHSGQTDLSGIPARLPDVDVRLRNMQ